MKVATVNDVRGNNFALATTGIGVAKLADSVGYYLAKALGMRMAQHIQSKIDQDQTYGSHLWLR
ncbi:MAG: hypothetical protein OEX15_11990 [Gammaproteobacteria bacterium]|jgi:hypothetical protein|nr:hypothetical protein [Gammaproteobacteria bacterium]